MLQNNKSHSFRWLLFSYSVPSKPVSNRMRVWRKLSRAGAVPLKGSLYILPYNEEHYEFFQWLTTEVTSMGGEGVFVKVEGVETMNDGEIIKLFNRQRAEDYGAIEKRLEELDIKVNSIRKGSGKLKGRRIQDEMNRLIRDYEDIRRTDFFTSRTGTELRKRIDSLLTLIRGLSGKEEEGDEKALSARRKSDYQGKVWVTRRGPFVDRMASAWLIRRFIDKKAEFRFMDEKDMDRLKVDAVTFDVRGGDFTHTGDMCTFEVLIKVFGLKEKALRKISEVVHEIDTKDGKYSVPGAKGIEDLLNGARKSAKNDTEALKMGMDVFELLFKSMA